MKDEQNRAKIDEVIFRVFANNITDIKKEKLRIALTDFTNECCKEKDEEIGNLKDAVNTGIILLEHQEKELQKLREENERLRSNYTAVKRNQQSALLRLESCQSELKEKTELVEKIKAKYQKEWDKYGMGANVSYSKVISDLNLLNKE